MSRRAICVLIGLLGIGVAVSPGLQWYRLDLVGRIERVSGFAAAGELWVLPALGVIITAVATTLCILDPDPRSLMSQWLVGAAAVCGVFALFWILHSVIDVGSTASAAVPNAPPIPLRPEAPGLFAAAAAALVVAGACVWRRSGSRPTPPSGSGGTAPR